MTQGDGEIRRVRRQCVGGWEVSHVEIRRRDRDPAVPVVLVHGMVVSGRYLLPTAERLAVHRDVFIPDLPGYGRSASRRRVLPERASRGSARKSPCPSGTRQGLAAPGHAPGVEALADALDRWLQKIGVGPMLQAPPSPHLVLFPPGP